MRLAETRLEPFYQQHFRTLTELGVSKYRLDHHEAETLAHDILIASLHQSHRITDPSRWFTGALSCAMRRRGHV